MSQITIQDLSFTYPGSFDPVFEHLSFSIDSNWKLGCTGRNGRGKTTLLRLMQGEYEYTGSIRSNLSFDYFPFLIPDPALNTRALLDKLQPELEEWRLLREFALLGLDEALLERPFSTLSQGERTKVLLSLLFSRENRFLLIDEPTNHLDMAGRALVSKYLSDKKGFLLVSHDRAFLDGCVDHILSLNKTTVEVQRGNFSSWWENRQRRDSFELAENEKLKKEIRRLQETAREKAQWSERAERKKIGINPAKVDNKKGYAPKQAAKAKKTMARAKAIEGRQAAAIEEKSKLLRDLEEAEPLKLRQLSYHSERLMRARELTVDYGTGPLFEPLSFEMKRGDRLALLGPNGAGKTSLIKLICGEAVPHTGLFERGSGLIVSCVPQSSEGLRGDMRSFIRESQIDESLFKAILRKLNFSRAQFEKDLGELSAGQKKKLLLARSLCQEAHLHIWDEPLNYIDLLSRIQLQELIMRFEPTLLFVEHDRRFVDELATACLTLKRPEL